MRGLRRYLALVLACAASFAFSGVARAEISDNVVRVGVLNDVSGIFQDTNGMGSVEAARVPAEDFGGGAKDITVDIVSDDHQNIPHVGSAHVSKCLDDRNDAALD